LEGRSPSERPNGHVESDACTSIQIIKFVKGL
jgi:hypothetical protein